MQAGWEECNAQPIIQAGLPNGSPLIQTLAIMPNPKPLSHKELTAVSTLPGPERYKHFVGRVADLGFVWGLRSESGWVAVGDGEGNEGIPFWPRPEYAQACAAAEWEGNEPSPIEIHEFVEAWLPDMASRSVMVSVFPTPKLRGVFIDPLGLQTDIQNELARLE